MSATCHFWVVSESDLRVNNKHPLKFKKKRHTENIGAPKAREKIGFWSSCKAETDWKNKHHLSKNKGHMNKKERTPKFRIPEKGKELLDFYAPFKGGFLFLTLW